MIEARKFILACHTGLRPLAHAADDALPAFLQRSALMSYPKKYMWRHGVLPMGSQTPKDALHQYAATLFPEEPTPLALLALRPKLSASTSMFVRRLDRTNVRCRCFVTHSRPDIC